MPELRRIDDPRSNLQKATRGELNRFAKERSIPDWDTEAPADIMREQLMRMGITNINLPPRILGSRNYWNRRNGPPLTVVPPQGQSVPAVDAKTDLVRQYEKQKTAQAPQPAKRYNEITAVRQELKRRGVKFSRRDNLKTLKGMLNGQDAAKLGQ